MAQEDQGYLREDVHVTGERQRHEENTETRGVEPPRHAFEVYQHEGAHVRSHPSAQRTGEESPAAIKGAGRAFGDQARREYEPQGRKRNAVARHMLGRAAHAHPLREKALAPGQRYARQDEQQQQIHQEIEDRLMLEPRRKVLEEDMPLQRHIAEPEVGDGLDPPHGDQQEPAKGQAHVHVAQQRVDPEDPAVEQRFADDLPYRREGTAGRQPEQDPFLVGERQAVEPQAPLPQQHDEHHRGADHERYAEWCEKSHRQKSPSLRLISITTPRVLIPRGHTRRHLPHSMHLFISS